MKHVDGFLIFILVSSPLYGQSENADPVVLSPEAQSVIVNRTNFQLNYQSSGRYEYTSPLGTESPREQQISRLLNENTSINVLSNPLIMRGGVSTYNSANSLMPSSAENRPFRLDFSGININNTSVLSNENCRYSIPMGNIDFENFASMWTTQGNNCFNSLSNGVNLTTEGRLRNQVDVCECLRRTSFLVQHSMDYAEARGGTAFETDVGGVRLNVSLINRNLENRQNGLLLQASMLGDNPNEARSIGGLFSNRSSEMNDVVNSFVLSGQEAIRERANALGSDQGQNETGISTLQNSLNASASALEAPSIDTADEIMTGGYDLKAGQCVAIKDFLAFNQIPRAPEFYQELATEEFSAENWDESQLRDKLNALVSQGSLRTPEYWKIRSRISFLRQNQLWRAVFSSKDPTSLPKKKDLFNILKDTMGSTRCPPRAGNDEVDCRARFFNDGKFRNYRNAAKNFLAQDGVTSLIAQSEIVRAKQELTPEIIRQSLFTSPVAPTTSLGYENYMTSYNKDILRCHEPARQNLCVFSFAAFCPQAQVISNNFKNQETLPFTPQDFEYEDTYINESNPDENPQYQEFNRRVCQERASLMSGSQPSFDSFRARHCRAITARNLECGQSAEARRLLTLEYFERYPRRGGSNNSAVDPEDEAFSAFLKETPVTELARGSFAASPSNGSGHSIKDIDQKSDEVFSNISGISRNLQRTNFAATTEAQKTGNAQGSKSEMGKIAASNNNLTNNQTSLAAGFVPTGSGEAFAAISQPTLAPDPEVLRSRVRKSDADLNRITEQLSSLREDVRRDTQSANFDQSAPQYRDLMERMSSLERSVTDERGRNAELKRQLTEAESRVASAPSVAGDGQSPSPQTSRAPASVSPVAAATSAGATAGAQTGGQASAQAQVSAPSFANAAFTPVTSLAQATRITGGQINTALLSKYSVQSITSQGSIIVADPNPSINLQQLRSDSSEQVLRLTFSEADVGRFSQDEGQALSAYLDQVSNSPGEVVRVLITLPGSSEPVERFVLKGQGRLSIVPPPAPVSRAPAGGPRYRLIDLVNELQANP